MSTPKQPAPKRIPTAKEFAEALKNFKPRVPFSFMVAVRKAIRNQ